MKTTVKARVESVYPTAQFEFQPGQMIATDLFPVTRLLTADGLGVEVKGELDPDVEYDVEVTVTPRRWAPPNHTWHGDELRRMYSDSTGFRYSLCTAVDGRGRAIKVHDERCNLLSHGVPAEVFRAFEKAGLL